MNLLVVGSGAREHTLAWKLSSSSLAGRLYCAPGNAGTASLGTNLNIRADDIPGILQAVLDYGIDMVVVGPELPLSLGLADQLQKLRPAKPPLCFGPSAAAARIESSKSFAKSFMRRHGISTAEFKIFNNADDALRFVQSPPWPFVIKATGLASGKGVFLPDSPEEAIAVIESLMKEKSLGDAGSELVIEERLTGEELSLLGFCDGNSVKAMPPSQDHKRLLENDIGPNTGGMGAIAAASPGAMAKAQALAETFLLKACRGLAEEASPFVGTLYVGLIMTKDGPKALEYNCRFGDPETQALLPLLDSDLGELMVACVQGRLDSYPIQWKHGACATVVLASEGYAQSSEPDQARALVDFGGAADSFVFHGATRLSSSGDLLAVGGRLLSVSAWADSLSAALRAAYSRLALIDLPRSRYRRDIGRGRSLVADFSGASPAAARSTKAKDSAASRYAAAGVDIEAGEKAVELMTSAVRSTYGPEVLAGIGSFGGMYDAAGLAGMEEPVLVASTDGVGTKVKLASQFESFSTIGMDIVNHCVDDILVQGAKPLFFLDYIASSRLEPSMVAAAVAGMAEACRNSGCALIGGETAEMPGVYLPDEFDLAGAIVGVVEKGRRLPLAEIKAGDLLVGFSSSGLHTNGFSLARSVFSDEDYLNHEKILGKPLHQALLEPHRSYLQLLYPILDKRPGMIKALAHITGGGFEGNVPRVLPGNLDARLRADSWPMPPLFRLIMEKGRVQPAEMYRVFNMGIGMVAVLAPGNVETLLSLVQEKAYLIGELVPGEGKAILDGLPRLIQGANEAPAAPSKKGMSQ
ncbi:MAG: phosphoribosylamine--glycine ligase [Spirochaetia bacterium]|jgi:phosphoribosylamine--glycine ligase/phosphoribosylaminoimidazole synthetase|nr:phosphoribosylamine--glycine ligase [Spirochaetales bacterium]MDX9783521.1 phosphoribosylamine--glycine ligase [Spirochaetia bacterium]